MEVEKELEDKRVRNRFVKKMRLNVNKAAGCHTMMVPAMIGPLRPSMATTCGHPRTIHSTVNDHPRAFHGAIDGFCGKIGPLILQ